MPPIKTSELGVTATPNACLGANEAVAAVLRHFNCESVLLQEFGGGFAEGVSKQKERRMQCTSSCSGCSDMFVIVNFLASFQKTKHVSPSNDAKQTNVAFVVSICLVVVVF